MEFRQLGRSGLKVPVLSLGTGTFGGTNEFFAAWGNSGIPEATRLVDICLEAGCNMFDTADIYSDGASETVLGGAIAGRRDKVLISTKATFAAGKDPNNVGSSRFHLINAVEGSLPSKKFSARSTFWSAAEKFATSAVPIFPAGTS
jgi:aryl-alcohol dehydrogenase-like predicted oxidoreductase